MQLKRVEKQRGDERMEQTIPRSEFPRPDFVRSQWEPLNGTWEFSFEEPVFDREILVPFCYQSEKSGIGEMEDHKTVWYRRKVALEKEKLKGKHLLLKFGAVDSEARVWINGQYAGEHRGGYSSFEMDITSFVKAGENVICVQATDDTNADKPRGKQSWTGEKFGCWYTPCTGIWQSVWLEYVGRVHLERVKFTPDLSELNGLCEVFLSETEDTLVEVTATAQEGNIYLGSQRLLCRHGYGKTTLTFPDYDIRRDDLLWTPDNPNLIDVRIRVFSGGSLCGENSREDKSETADEVAAYFGMRSIAYSNGRISLNGNVFYQRLILDQGYWPDSILTPPSDEAIRKDILMTKEMGFNGARKHQKIEDPRYYYWADKLGLLVWGELPSAYEFNDRAVEASARELTRFVERDYNHPCIVTWVPVNESWGVRQILENTQQQDYCRMLTYLLRALDPVRLISSNDGWEQVNETDICAVHDYALFPSTVGKYDDMEALCDGYAESRYLFAAGNEYQGQPVILTEYGGIAFEKEEKGWGYYGKVKNEEEFLERLQPITEFLIRSGKFSGFCYTQLTDVMQEVNGLLCEDRTPKVPAEKLKEIFGAPVFA